MLSFLSPLALFGLAVLAVPVVIHLFKPKRVRVVPFSSLRWLRESQQRLSKRVQWHQLLLFLLRAGTLALLVLAAARPLLARRGGGGAAHRVVVIDAGRAMGYEGARGINAMTRAKSVAVDLLSEAAAGDLSSVCIVGETARALGPLTPDPSVFLDALARLNAEAGERPVTEALRLVPLLQRGKPRPERIELFFLTANLDASWRQSEIRDFLNDTPVPARVTVLSMAESDLQNAWIASADHLQGLTPGTQVLRVRVQANDAQITRRTVRLSGVKGMPDAEQDVALEAGRTAWATFELPVHDAAGVRTGLLTLSPSDALPDDDRYWVDLAPRGRQTLLLIEAETTQVRELQPAFHLRTALATLAEAAPGRFRVNVRAPEALQERDVMQADWVLWIDPRPVADDALAALRRRVQAGAGLALFLGPTTDFAFCNQALFQTASAEDSLLPRRLGETVAAGQGQPRVRLAGVVWSHPLLSPFADPVYGDLARVNFNAYARMEATATGRDRVLAAFPDDTPAILEADVGAGRVLVLNTSANDAWSDFPRLRGFLPWVDGLLVHLGGAPHGRNLGVGDAATFVLADLHENRPVQLLAPDGRPVNISLEARAGRRIVQSAPLSQPGIHTLRYTSGTGEAIERPVIVQTGRMQSRLMPMDAEVLEAWWAPAPLSVVVPETASRLYAGGTLRNSLERVLLLLAVVLFFCETLLASHLCPRANPRITSASTIAKRGFFRDQAQAAAPPGATTGGAS